MTNDNFNPEDFEGETLKGERKGIGPGTGTTDSLRTDKEFTIKKAGGIDGGPFSGYEDAEIEQDGEIKKVHPKNLRMIVEEVVE